MVGELAESEGVELSPGLGWGCASWRLDTMGVGAIRGIEFEGEYFQRRGGSHVNSAIPEAFFESTVLPSLARGCLLLPSFVVGKSPNC